MTTCFRSGFSLLAAALVSGAALAQSWPARPLTWVAPSTPGSAPDVLSRVVAQKLSEQLGQPIRPPEAGGVEEIELRTGREELRDGIVVVAIASMQDRRHAIVVTLTSQARLGCEQLTETRLIAGIDRIEHRVSGHRAPRRASGQIGRRRNRQLHITR